MSKDIQNPPKSPAGPILKGYFVKVNTARIAKSEQYPVKQLSVRTGSSLVKGKP